ncbi:MAG: hypothetical protein CSB16_00015 [Clostridiales bacterium]|nr:MAG: hypothetical protein CSB16_00015 [Clostridiales bacterium]
MKPYIIIGVILLVIVVMYQVFYNRFTRTLSTLLYKKFDFDASMKKLNSFEAKLFMGKRRRFLFYVDAYILKNNEEMMNDLFRKNQNLKFSYGQQVSLNTKLLQFFIDVGNKEQALEHYNNLKKLSEMIDNKHMDNTMQNAEMLVEVEINKNPNYLKNILSLIDKTDNDMIRGIYYFRAAKCAHYSNDKRAIDKYLKKARNLTSGSIFVKQIDKAIADNSLLD